MSDVGPRRRLRDRLFSKHRSERNTSDSSVPTSSHAPVDLNLSSLSDGVSSSSQTTSASSSNFLPVLLRPRENADSHHSGDQNLVEARSEKLTPSATSDSVVIEPSLWALAYDALQRANPELIKKFNYCLGLNSTDIDNKILVFPSIDRVVQKAFEELKEAGGSDEKLNRTSATIRKYFEQTIKIIIASKDYISSAVSANPYAALAWTGVSVLLPLLLSPTEENEAAIKGLDYVTNLMIVYEWKEKIYLHDGDAVLEFKDQATRLYTMILDYAATLLVHMHQYPPKRWARDVFQAGDWDSRIKSIQERDTSCRDVTDAIAAVRAKQWQNEERRWYEKLLQQPRQDEERSHIRTLYSNYNADKNINPERIAGTCEWFLNHDSFLTWRVSRSSTLLWLSADPGCGKSVLAKYLVDRRGEALTVNTETPTLCYFFFKDGDIDRVDATKAICAFLHQLIMQQPHLYQYAKEDFKNKSEKFLTDFDALWNIFLKATANASGQEIICVLDALDECHERSRKALIAELVQLYSLPGSTNSGKPILKFLVTSRPDFNIVRDFKGLTSTISEVRLRGEEESEYISHEIDLVIHYKVKQLGSKMDLSESHQSSLRDNLLSIPHRTYLWLYLTFDTIEKGLELTKSDIAVITRTIPKNVEEAYTAILDKSPDRTRARRLLHIVLAAIRPLSLLEANVAIVMEENQDSYKNLDFWPVKICEDRIKNMCGLFLSVVDSKVYLIHQTAREFLVGDDYISSSLAQHTASPVQWKESFSPERSNLLLAEICIWYLQLRDFENEELAPTEEESEEEESEEEESEEEESEEEESEEEESEEEESEKVIKIRQIKENYIFLSYAAKSWAAHFTQAKNLPSFTLVQTVADEVCNTLNVSFRIWVAIYCEAEMYLEDLSCFPNIIAAAYFGHDAVVKLLLEREDVQVNSRDDMGRTPLSWAATKGHEAVVSLFLERKDVQVNSRDHIGRTPLSWAAVNGHEAVVRLLLARKDVQVNSKNNYNFTPLLLAAKDGHEAVVRLLLARKNVQVNLKDDDNSTPLFWAAENGHEAVVKLLLEKDAQADSKDSDGRTPLSYAARWGYEKVVKLLLEKDVQADSKDNVGRTPLSYAARYGYKAVVKLLLQKDVQADSKDYVGRTPLSYAADWGNEEVVKLLEQHLHQADHLHSPS
ncbi:hypothetical protein MMC27_001577 [Xylographa pallens]|nr:hypothetical protein [Xylographa pallens]